MRAPYRAYPGKDGSVHLYPLIRVCIGKKHGQKTRPFEALVDSGASDCMFPEAVATAIASSWNRERESRNGIGGSQDVWIHPVLLYVGSEVLAIEACFAKSLPVGGLLGRVGFFEHFKITFDPTSDPPGMELERVHKA